MKLSPRLFKEARHSQNALIFSICLGLLGGIIGVLQARQVSKIINQVFLEHQTLKGVSFLLILILLLIVLRVSCVWVAEIGATAVARQIKQDIRHRLFTHLYNLGPAFLRSEAGEAQARTGELVTTAIEGIDALEVYFSQYLPQIALAALIPLSILFFVFPIDILSGVIFLVTAPLLPLFMYLIGSAAEHLTRRQWQGLSRMSAYFLDVLQGLTTLKTLGRSKQQIEVIQKVSEQYRQSTMSVLKVTFLSALVLELIATLSTAVVAVEIGLRLLYGQLVFEQAFFLLLLAPEFYQPLRLLGTRFHAGMSGVEAARRIFEILDIPITRNHQQDSHGLKITGKIKSPPSISLKDVGYSYSNGHVALQEITFDILPGKVTALTGESGAGKTTLTWLLLCFLQPKSGQILVDGIPIFDLPNSQWLENLAWVSQNPYLFNDTILANIKLAKPDANDEAIYEAACLAHADEFINNLPMGYQTQIGERGMRLSTGQAQRIALARAFLKKAPLLILDEATSHLDPDTDTLIRTSMERLFSGRTVLVIAHHRSTLAMADQVVTLSHGKVIQITEVRRPSKSDLHTHDQPLPVLNPLYHSHASPMPIETGSGQPPQTQKRLVERRLLKLLAPYVGRIALSVIIGFATVASGVGLMATAAYIIAAAALHPSIAELQVAIVGVRFFGLSRGVFRYLERLVSHDTTLRLLARWRTWFYQALEPLAPARLTSYHSGDLLTRVISDIGSLENFYVRSIAPPLIALLVGIATTLFLGGFGHQLAWGTLFFFLLAGIGLPLLALFFSRKLGPKIIHERARLSTLLVDGVQGMADIDACGQAPTYIERVRHAGELLSRVQAQMAVLTASQTAFSGLLANLGMLTVLVLAIQRVSQGQMQGVLLGVAVLTALTSFEAMQPLPLAAQYYDANRAAASRLYELVDASPAVTDPPTPLSIPGNPGLDVQKLSFEYPNWVNGKPATSSSSFSLKNISFSLPTGKHIALIGPSGAGKTTIVNILLRFWEYPQGSIHLGEHELRQYSSEDVRRCMAVISQNTYLFTATIKENLLIARPQATEDEICEAAKQAQLHEFIVSLTDGYDTWIGEHGLRLSAGERQRLAVARALLMDAPLLILDEPTANLDPTTELALMNSIRLSSLEHSTLTITQSMVGLEAMDEILVMWDGCILERGRHDQLISYRGLYYRMWELYHQLL